MSLSKSIKLIVDTMAIARRIDFDSDEILDGLKPPPPLTATDRATRSRSTIVRITPRLVGNLADPNGGFNGGVTGGVWKLPPWARTPKVNKTVLQVADDLKKFPHLKSTLVLGVYDGCIWKIDCNHRLLGFLYSELECITAHCIFHYCDSHEEMYEFYKIYQRHIRTPTKDDNLKGFEITHPPLKYISSKCRFVTYNSIGDDAHRRIKMSTVVQAWYDSVPYIPRHVKGNVEEQAAGLTKENAEKIVEFLLACRDGLGLDQAVLWKQVNIVLLMWLYRRLVWGETSLEEEEDQEYSTFTKDQFINGIMGLQANSYYGALHRRKLDSDRMSVYQSLINHFRNSLKDNKVKIPKLCLPTRPSWPKDPIR